ncbi:hypothetical protein PA598K_01689 [Paenibacillus sp. 598K]|uniref:GNAT family N-acetyltransferase n=1 Tax=Paenibacillus sp. 598K TaxID=1117987 RepID=UPI000FF9B7F6|nr:GNAT family N-acetyltransferase [Paenibacillus sp. 598K]GBF73400.1 hypothetical protein PA598K_01689 [Paenibacillus sp. 598K]
MVYLELRSLKPSEAEASLDLSFYAFQIQLSEQEYEKAIARFKPDRVIGAFDDGELVAQLSLLPLATYVGGKSFAMGGIANVSSWPERRRKGAVTQLFKHTLKRMKDNGQMLSFLAPFDFPFYRRYGWELYVEYKAYTIEKALLPQRQAVEGTVKRISVLDEALVQQISPLYDAYARRYSGTLSRSTDWWFDELFRRRQGQVAIYTTVNGDMTGYLFYQVSQREMTVHEFVYHDEEARLGLWNYISNHDSMIDRAHMKAPVDDALAYMIPNPRFEQKIIPYFMGRIVDVEHFLAAYPFETSTEQIALTIAVNDEYAPWNEAIYELKVNEKGVLVTKYKELKTGQAALACSIQTLTAMLLGFKRPTALWQLQQLQGDQAGVKQLEACLPQQTTYLLDYF